jgi:hypothetical protein
MPIPEGYLPRRGDVVVVRAEVRYDVKPSEDTDEDGVQVFVRPLEGYTDVRVPVRTLVGLWSRRFYEGDRVRAIVEPGAVGTVAAISDEHVWVKFDATATLPEHFETFRSENLKPIDPVDEPFVEPEAESAAPEHDPLRGPDGEEIKF